MWGKLEATCISNEPCLSSLNILKSNYSDYTYQLESNPVRLKSAHNFKRFLIELSECDGKARLMSSILIRRGLSRDFQNNR